METLSDKRKAYLTGENQYGERDVKEFIRLLKETAPKDEIDSLEYDLVKEINKLAGDKLI